MIEFRPLKQDEFELWLDHVTYVFTKGTMSQHMRDYFIKHYNNDPHSNPENILVAYKDGVIMSSLKIVVREFFVEGESIKFGGIAEVSTKPEFGGQGHAGMLLKLAIRIMEDRGYNVSMLSAGIPLYYNKYGWHQVIQNLKTVKVDDSVNCSLSIRKADFSKDISTLKSIWDQYRSRFNGIVNRTEEYWEKWYATEGEETYLAFEPNGKCVAYICICENEENAVFVQEFGCIGGYDSAFEPLSAEAVRIFDKEFNAKQAATAEAAVDSTAPSAPSVETDTSPEANTSTTVSPTTTVAAAPRKTTLIKLHSAITTRAENYVDSFTNQNMMARMILPFKIGNRLINNSEDIVTLLQRGTAQQSIYVHWGIDGF